VACSSEGASAESVARRLALLLELKHGTILSAIALTCGTEAAFTRMFLARALVEPPRARHAAPSCFSILGSLFVAIRHSFPTALLSNLQTQLEDRLGHG